MKFREKQFFYKSSIVIGMVALTLLLFYFLFLNDFGSQSFFDNENTNIDIEYVKNGNIHWPIPQELSKSNYPKYKPLLQVIEEWNPDNPEIPTPFIETLQHFNYSDPKERQLAEIYRNAEVPFKLYDIPELDVVRKKWNYNYLKDVMHYTQHRVEKSKSNHFMFFGHTSFANWKPPQAVVSMSWSEWYHHAQEADQNKLSNESIHYYYTVGSRPKDTSHSFVARDLPFFSTQKNNFFITKVESNKGIQCRFGMRGVIAETHYDSGRNMIAMIKGRKRYVLTPPNTCKYLGIIANKRHPSYRHSEIDWSSIEEAKKNRFDLVNSIDTIVNEGEILYLPSFWFHYIVSLEYSIQCNSRSGFPSNMVGWSDIKKADCMNQRD